MFESDKLNSLSKHPARINRNGAEYVEYCKAIGLWIVNGSIGRDKCIRDFIREDKTGRSTFDYVVWNPELFQIIDDFTNELRLPECGHRGL